MNKRRLNASRVIGAIAAVVVAGALGCSTRPGSPSSPTAVDGGSTQARPETPQLNLSSVTCVDGHVEVHFVLLFVPAGVTPGDDVTYNWGGGTGHAPRGKNVGNVWHYTDTLPSGSTVNITSATVQVGAQVISLHNPGAYAGTYNCVNDQCSGLPAAQTLVCLDSPLGSEAAECSYFLPGSTPLGKDDPVSSVPQPASQSAAMAIVKAGSGQTGCSPGQQAYRTYTNVHVGDLLSPPGTGDSISHVTYCSCPAQ